MPNELALAVNNPKALNKLFGFSSKPAPIIPYLKINGADDEGGTRAPKGTFVYENGDNTYYTDAVTIRSFVKAYQYRLFDGKEPSKNDQSIIAMSFKEEFRSTSGRIACGKMNKKMYAQLGDNATALQKYLQDNVKCKLLVFGLVSGEFTDLDSKAKVDIKDQLFVWAVSQSGFMAIDSTITGIEKENRAVPLTPIKITLKKEKQGSVTYFTPVPNVLNETAALDIDRDGAYLGKIRDFVKSSNDFVNGKYNDTKVVNGQDNNFAKTTHVIEGKAKVADPLDFDGAIPF